MGCCLFFFNTKILADMGVGGEVGVTRPRNVESSPLGLDSLPLALGGVNLSSYLTERLLPLRRADRSRPADTQDPFPGLDGTLAIRPEPHMTP